MKLTRVRMAGFRGVRESLDIAIPNGFLVVSGRNGSGKSTLCDAVEYGLTGHISKYDRADAPLKAEAGERIDKYFWWQGERQPPERTVEFEFSDGFDTFSWTRDYTKQFHGPPPEGILYNATRAPSHPLFRLAETMLIRDEAISSRSMDMPPRQRYELVRAALPAFEFEEIEKRISATRKVAKERLDDAKLQAEKAGQRYQDYVEYVAAAERRAAEKEDPQLLADELSAVLGEDNHSPKSALEIGRERISFQQQRRDDLSECLQLITHLAYLEFESPSDTLREQITEAQTETDQLQARTKRLQNAIAEDQQTLDRTRQQSTYFQKLSELAQLGREVGIDDGHCPLCGSERESHDFYAHINRIETQHASFDNEILSLRERLDTAQTDLDRTRRNLRETNESLNNLQSALAERDDLRDRIDRLRSNLGIRDPETLNALREVVESTTEHVNGQIERLINLTHRLESARTDESLEALHIERDKAQNQEWEANRKVSHLSSAIDNIDTSRKTVRRLTGDFTEHQIESIEPLLQELYARMRPHDDYRRARMVVRGDVQRSLGFATPNDLNPALMFSSGQRRAAGLAFLISVNLARTWSNVSTYIFDDPVQHVDDFRAIHVAETLTALCRSGRQIICTVEDPSLARLLARRLCHSHGVDGKHVELAYTSTRGVHIKNQESIVPPSQYVFSSTG